MTVGEAHKEGSVMQERGCLQQRIWQRLFFVSQDGKRNACDGLESFCGLLLHPTSYLWYCRLTTECIGLTAQAPPFCQV